MSGSSSNYPQHFKRRTMALFWNTVTGAWRIESDPRWSWTLTAYPHWRTGGPRPAYRPEGVQVTGNERVFIRHSGWLWELTPDGGSRGTARPLREAIAAIVEPLWEARHLWLAPDDRRLSGWLDPAVQDQREALAA